MRTFSFNATIGLLLDDTGTTLVLLTDLEALVSKITQRLQFFLGEWFLNTTIGVPYFQHIFEKPVDPSLIVILLNDQITQEPDVETVDEASIEFNREQRTFSYSAVVTTIYGTAPVSTSVTV